MFVNKNVLTKVRGKMMLLMSVKEMNNSRKSGVSVGLFEKHECR